MESSGTDVGPQPPEPPQPQPGRNSRPPPVGATRFGRGGVFLLPPLAPCPASSPGRMQGVTPLTFPCGPGHKPARNGAAAGKGKLRQGGGGQAPARSTGHEGEREKRIQGPPCQLVPPRFRCLGIHQSPEHSQAWDQCWGHNFGSCESVPLLLHVPPVPLVPCIPVHPLTLLFESLCPLTEASSPHSVPLCPPKPC